MPAALKRLYERFLKIRGSPRQIALGMALGLWVGMTPTMGVQTVIAVFLASVFKWSKITAAIGVQITNPVTAPMIYGATYLVGARLMGVSPGGDIGGLLNLDGLVHLVSQAPMILTAMTLGGLILGLPLAAAGYAATFFAVSRYQARLKPRLTGKLSKVGQMIRHPRTRKRHPRK